MQLEYISPPEKPFRDEEIEELARFCAGMPVPVDPTDILNQAAAGIFQFYRVKVKGASGLLITQIQIWPQYKQLWIWGMVGKGIVTHAAQVILAAQKIAAEKGCLYMAGESTDPRLWRLYERHGATVTHKTHRLPVPQMRN